MMLPARGRSEPRVTIGTSLIGDSSEPGRQDSLSIRWPNHELVDIATVVNDFKIHIFDKTSLIVPCCKGHIEQCSYRRELRSSTKRTQPDVVREFRRRGAIQWLRITVASLKSDISCGLSFASLFEIPVAFDILLTRKHVDGHLFQPPLPAVALQGRSSTHRRTLATLLNCN
uniref:ASPIC/UnbV domain-containing protein n=1 Tax=Angiostrongylus cantonensis TaxID=6313 RepID=A0A0K0D2H2_ANGCA